jgi:formate dehydrogenase maturation protein FdhE
VARTGNKWDQRIDRARELAKVYPFSAEILSFYCKLTAFQKTSYLQFQSAAAFQERRRGSRALPLDEPDLGLLLTRWSPFLSLIAHEAPASLAEFARGLNSRGSSAGTALLRSIWPGDRETGTKADSDVGAPLVGAYTAPPQQGATTTVAPTSIRECEPTHRKPLVRPPEQHNPHERFCAQAYLEPYAEFLADQADVPEPPLRRPVCPYCGSPPLVGVLRPEGDGAKRSLVCSFCRTEWDYMRIACAGCEERREEKLCVYSTPAFDGVRVEACDTCRAYIKTIDLTRNGLALPEVDELAAVPLTLWAEENGYRKVAPNVIGL